MKHSLIEINFQILLLKKPLLVVLRIKKSLSSRQRLSYLEPHSRNRQRKRVKGGRGFVFEARKWKSSTRAASSVALKYLWTPALNALCHVSKTQLTAHSSCAARLLLIRPRLRDGQIRQRRVVDIRYCRSVRSALPCCRTRESYWNFNFSGWFGWMRRRGGFGTGGKSRSWFIPLLALSPETDL